MRPPIALMLIAASAVTKAELEAEADEKPGVIMTKEPRYEFPPRQMLEIVGVDGTSEAHLPRRATTAEWLAAEQARLDRERDRLSPADKAAISAAARKNARKAAKRLSVKR